LGLVGHDVPAASVSLPSSDGGATREGVIPLNELLIQAMEIAKRREPGLTELEIAARAGVARSHLSRAKKQCGAATLAAVFDVLGFDLALIEVRPKKAKRASR
jgi:DNA-binding phage protein